MASCPDCHRSNDDSARFCGGCGQPLSESLELLGIDQADVVQADSRIVTRRSVPSTRIFAAVGVVLAAIVIWSILTTSGQPEAVSVADDLADPDGLPHLGASTTTLRVPPTTASGEVSANDPSTEPGEVAPGAGPVFGEEIGYSILLGGERALRRVDLDTGVLTEYGRRALPMAVAGDRLVVQYQSDGRIGSLPLSDLDGEPVTLSTGFASYPLATSVEPDSGEVWTILSGELAGPVFVRFDASTGELIDEIRVEGLGFEDFGFFGPSFRITADPDLISPDAGGVYQRSGAEYQRVADGRVLTFDATRALVETCDASLLCATRWWDRATWEPVDLPLPADRISGAALVGGGHWLLTIETLRWKQTLLNLETGATRSLDPELTERVAVSPDGRYLGYFNRQGQLVIEDFDTGVLVEIPFVTDRSWGALLFVENATFAG